ncbi:MAG: ATP-binding protein [Bryobacterales bacterium]|nr:ATP-binding protein [Bryobacterales bacterium]
MIPRAAEPVLRQALERFPAVGLLGPRQAGKTTLALEIASSLGDRAVYLDLELPSDRAKLQDAELYLSGHEGRLVILDEIHRTPDIFQTLRGLIDGRRRRGIRTGQYLLLGSASVDLLKQSAESLAGRIRYIELGPLAVQEVLALDPGALDRLWVRGGFPDSFLAPGDAESLEWRRAFLQTSLERDLPALGPRVPSETLYRFWQMLAHNQGQLLNAARLASGLGVSGQTVARYLDTLVDLLLVRRLQPWTANPAKRLVRSPKTYVRDSGVVHALLGIGDRETLLGHPVAGPSWEGFVIENGLALLPAGSRAWYYRTAAGAEIDLLVEHAGGALWAIEVKRSLSSPHPSKGFHLACEDLGVERRTVVYPGTERYALDSGVEIVPLAMLRATG